MKPLSEKEELNVTRKVREAVITKLAVLILQWFASKGINIRLAMPEFHLSHVRQGKGSATRASLVIVDDMVRGKRPQCWLSEEMDFATISRVVTRVLLQCVAGRVRVDGKVKQTGYRPFMTLLGLTGQQSDPQFSGDSLKAIREIRKLAGKYPEPTCGKPSNKSASGTPFVGGMTVAGFKVRVAEKDMEKIFAMVVHKARIEIGFTDELSATFSARAGNGNGNGATRKATRKATKTTLPTPAPSETPAPSTAIN